MLLNSAETFVYEYVPSLVISMISISDKARFYTDGFVNKQTYRYWIEDNLQSNYLFIV